MSKISQRFNDKRKTTAINALRELATKLETGQLVVANQGLWPGATPNVWNFHLEVREADVEVLAETLRDN